MIRSRGPREEREGTTRPSSLQTAPRGHSRSSDLNDPDYRRLRYIRYADDFLLGFVGPEGRSRGDQGPDQGVPARSPQARTLRREDPDHPRRTEKARFLGYDIGTHGQRSQSDGATGTSSSASPPDVMQKDCSRYKRNGKPIHRPELHPRAPTSASSTQYGAEYRGIVQYYALARNIAWLPTLHWVMRSSLLKTLAGKHKTSVTKMADVTRGRPSPDETVDEVPAGRDPPRCARASSRWSPPSAASRSEADIVHGLIEERPRIETACTHGASWSQRLLADECEICGSTDEVQVHHVRKLATSRSGPKGETDWMQIMVARRRKTLVVCE